MNNPKLIEDPGGMVFEYLQQDEAEFLYEEVFTRRSYLRHGIRVENGSVVVDAGANIGLFSLQCLREASEVQIYAFEPIPVIYDVLVRNLRNYSLKFGDSNNSEPRPLALQIALGAEHGYQEFTFFSDSPGESTSQREEREEQRRILHADVDAASWRRVLHGGNAPVGAEVTGSRVAQGKAGYATNKGGEDSWTCGVPESVIAVAEGKGLVTSDPAFQTARAVSPKVIASTAGAFAGNEALTNQGDEECHRGDGARSEIGGFESNSAGQDGVEEKEQDGHHQERAFMCSVVPLSLALRELGLASVNLLKVDVEGDELAVLRGIDEEDWPKIQQLTVEVHDIDDRLASTVDLLTSKPAAFDEVCWELQRTSEVDGYLMVMPSALKLYLVFAKRRRKPGVAGSLAMPATAQDSLCESTSRGIGEEVSARDTAWRGGRDRQQKGGGVPMPSEYCSCSCLDEKV